MNYKKNIYTLFQVQVCLIWKRQKGHKLRTVLYAFAFEFHTLLFSHAISSEMHTRYTRYTRCMLYVVLLSCITCMSCFAFDTMSAGTATLGVILLLRTASLAKRTRLHMVLSIIHYSSQSHRYVYKEQTKRGTVPLLWLVWLLSCCPSCVLLTLWLIAAVGMRHDDHNAGGMSCNFDFHVSRAHVVVPPPSRRQENLTANRLQKPRPYLRSWVNKTCQELKGSKSRGFLMWLILSVNTCSFLMEH